MRFIKTVRRILGDAGINWTSKLASSKVNLNGQFLSPVKSVSPKSTELTGLQNCLKPDFKNRTKTKITIYSIVQYLY
jgi:hypothetical protein